MLLKTPDGTLGNDYEIQRRSLLMKINNILALILLFLQIVVFGGCGSGGGASGPASTLADSQKCISCHSGADPAAPAVDPITGHSITADWLNSAHNTGNASNKSGAGAGCQNCHGPAHNHPNSCGGCHGGSSPLVGQFLNPDATLQCNICHGPAAKIKPLGSPHFNNITSPREIETTGLKRNGYPASFVTSKGVGKCRNCHNPHNPTGHILRNLEWASSGHGNVLAEGWRHYDFKTRGTSGAVPATSAATDCVRCHTTTGYINYVTSGFTDVHAWGVASDKTKEVLQCNACHDKSSNFTSQRALGAITSYYNYSSKNTKKLLVNHTFPNVGKSNICMCCHTGRESGLTLAAIAALPGSGASFVNYSTQSFVNSHYLTAGATIFGISGYELPSLNYNDPNFYAHKNIGVTLKTAGMGPCVSCHMQRTIDSQNNPSHKFKPELTSGIGVDCVGCHINPAGFGIPTPIPNTVSTEAKLETQKTGYNDALTVLAAALRKRGFKFQSANPYFTNTNWQTSKNGGTTGGFGAGTGANTMGSAFNFNLLVHDPGGFAHNSTYAKRLLHDSILWITTGSNSLPPGLTIADIINNISLVPTFSALVATKDGVPLDFTGTNSLNIRAAAIVWLTNGTGNRP